MRLALPDLRPANRRRLLSLAAAYALLVVAADWVFDSAGTAIPMLAIALSGLFLVTHPHWGILATFVLTMLRLNPARLGSFSSAELLALALLIPLAIELVRDRRVWIWDVPHVRLLLGIGCVFVVATGWSLLMHPAPPESLDNTWNEPFFFSQSLLFLIYFLYFIKTRRHLNYAVVVFLLLILAAAADGVGLLDDGPRRGGRAATLFFEGLAGNANRLGFLCVWGTGLFWALRFKAPAGWWRPLTVIPLVALPVTTLMTGSRGALIQLMLLGALILLHQRHWSPAQLVRAVALMAMVAVAVLVAVPDDMILRASNIDTTAGPTTIHRLQILEAGLVMIAAHPVFGVGPGNFPWRNQELTGSRNSPHNAYVWALTSGGPLLLILYLAVFYRTYVILRAVEREGPPELTWLATALRFNLIILLVGSWFATIWTSEPCWLLLGLTIVLGRLTGITGRRTPRIVPAMAGVAAR